MNATVFRVSGTFTKYGDTVFFFKDHSIFVTLEPSGKSLPLPGTPSLYAFIMTSFAAISFKLLSVWLTATFCQVSYPLNSDHASPFGIFRVYLSCSARAMLPKAASDAVMITITEDK